MKPALLVGVACAALLTAPEAVAAGNTFKLRVTHRGAAAPPPPAYVIPGATQPTARGTSGFTATVPGQQGNPGDYGGGTSVVGTWVNPQQMTISADTTLGAELYHESTAAEAAVAVYDNVAYADVYCDAGSAFRVSSRTTNPDTGLPAFNFVIDDAAGWSDGLHECQVVGVPNTGLPAALQGSKDVLSGQLNKSLFFTTNFGGSLTAGWLTLHVTGGGGDTGNCGSGAPCLTLSYAMGRLAALQAGGDVGGGTICVGNGTFTFGANTENFTRVAANQYVVVDSCGAGGSKADTTLEVNLNGAGGLRAQHIKVQDVTFNITTSGFQSGHTGTGTKAVCWFDNVDFVGAGRFIANSRAVASGACEGGVYHTGVSIDNMQNGADNAALVRTSTISNLGSDALSSVFTAIGNTVSGLDNRTFATGSTSIGSPTVTAVSDFTYLQVGGVLDICGLTGAQITAVNPGAFTLTIDENCLSDTTDASLATGTHPDMAQFSGASAGTIWDNIIFHGNNISGSTTQGFFGDGSSSAHMTDVVLVDNVWDNTVGGPTVFYIFQWGYHIDHAILRGNSWVGTPIISNVEFVPTLFSFSDETCTVAFGTKSGITYRDSATCD